MTKGYQLTFLDTLSHNLYSLMLAPVTQLPQRVDLGSVFPPDPVNSIILSLPISQSGNSGNFLSVQDSGGNEMFNLLPGINETVVGTGNNISSQAILVQASAIGVVLDVTLIQN